MSTPNNSPWWRSANKDRLSARIKHVNRINDPGTVADEAIFYGGLLMIVLLTFTGALGAFSYFRFFSGSFPMPAAVLMACTLTLLIEAGKNYAAKWAIRIPMFQGFNYVFTTPQNTFAWVGLLMAGAVCFSVSVFNSTKGSEQLSLMLHHEKNEAKFVANTADVDARIADCKERINRNNKNTWKGIVIYESQKANKRESELLNKLQDERKSMIEQQRSDFERGRDIKDGEAQFSASSIMAAGGWVELLQFVLIFIIVSCEKILDTRRASGATEPTNPIGFRSTGAAPPYPSATVEERRPIGFLRTHEPLPQPPHAVPQQVSVPQSPQSVAQIGARMKGVAAQQAILYHLGRLQREPSNFTNPHANAATVANRVHQILFELEQTLTLCDECPTEVANRVCSYIIDVIQPKLEQFDRAHDLTNIIARFREIGGQANEQ